MTSAFSEYDHWRIELDGENILWLALDRKGETSNSTNWKVLRRSAPKFGKAMRCSIDWKI